MYIHSKSTPDIYLYGFEWLFKLIHLKPLIFLYVDFGILSKTIAHSEAAGFKF